MRVLLRPLLAGLLGLSAALLVACGDSGGLIPARQASRLDADLGAIEQACNQGRPNPAQRAVLQAQTDAGNLSTRVDPRLRKRIVDGINYLSRAVPADCTATTDTTTTPTTTTPTTTTTTPTTTTPTTTTPPASNPATTPPPATEPTPTTPPAGGGAPAPGTP